MVRVAPQRGSAELSRGSATSCGGSNPLTPLANTALALCNGLTELRRFDVGYMTLGTAWVSHFSRSEFYASVLGSRYNNKSIQLFVTGGKVADNTVVIAVSVVVAVAALSIVLIIIAVLIYRYKLKTRCTTSQY